MAGTLLCLFVFNLDCGLIGLGFRSNGNYMFGRVGGHSHRPFGYEFPASVPYSAPISAFIRALGFVVVCLRFVGWFVSSDSQVCDDSCVLVFSCHMSQTKQPQNNTHIITGFLQFLVLKKVQK